MKSVNSNKRVKSAIAIAVTSICMSHISNAEEAPKEQQSGKIEKIIVNSENTKKNGKNVIYNRNYAN